MPTGDLRPPTSPRPTRANDLPGEVDPSVPRVRRFLHFWIQVVSQFVRNRGPVRASALAYTTLMALVPLLAISLSVSALFLPKDETERKEKLLEWIESGIAKTAPSLGLGDEDGRAQRELVASNIVSFVERIHFKTIGAAATLGLLVLVIGLLRTVEVTFNDIWGVRRSRNLAISIVYYWAVITLGPVVVVASKLANYFSYLDFDGSRGGNTGLDVAMSLISFGVVPVIVAAVFGALYYFMPNTRVTWLAALIGGAVASLLWTLNGQLSALYNTRVLTINAIYGSLGVLPLFLVGLYFTWAIVLFGAQVACTFQSHQTFGPGSKGMPLGPRVREELAVQIMLFTAREFTLGQPPTTLHQIARHLRVVPPVTGELLDRLQSRRLLNKTSQETGGYTPARPPESITIHEILQALDASESTPTERIPTPEASIARDILKRTADAGSEYASGVTLADLLRSAPLAPEGVRDTRGVFDS